MSASDTFSDQELSPAGNVSSDFNRLLSRYMRACSRREYCTGDIRRRLAAAGESSYAETLLGILKKEGFLDDERYARSYCRDKAQLSGWGAAKIRYGLILKGIPADVADRALSEVDRTAADRKLDAVIARKWGEISRRYPDVPKNEKLSRLLRFTSGRGYSYDEVLKSLGRMSL